MTWVWAQWVRGDGEMFSCTMLMHVGLEAPRSHEDFVLPVLHLSLP